MKTKKLTNKPLVVKLNYAKYETGMSPTAMKQFINKSVKYLISHSEDKAVIKESIRLATKMGQKKTLTKTDINSFDEIKNSLGKFKRDRNNKDFVFFYGGNFSTTTMQNTVLTKKDISNKTINSLKKMGILNKTQTQQFKDILAKGGGKKARQFPILKGIVEKGTPKARQIMNVIDVIENMGGFVIALDKYFEDVERLVDYAGMSLEEFNEIYFGDEPKDEVTEKAKKIVYKIFYPF